VGAAKANSTDLIEMRPTTGASSEPKQVTHMIENPEALFKQISHGVYLIG